MTRSDNNALQGCPDVLVHGREVAGQRHLDDEAVARDEASGGERTHVGGECRLRDTYQGRGNDRRWGERREVLGCARRLVLVCPYTSAQHFISLEA